MTMHPESEDISNTVHHYFLFQIGQDKYAVPLLGVREVSELGEIRRVPNTVDAFVGLMNLRGTVVGVIDLAKRFGVDSQNAASRALFLVESADTILGAIVDRILAVVEFLPEQIDSNAQIITPISAEFIKGVARLNQDIIPILNLAKVMDHEEFVALPRSKTPTAS